MHLQRFRINLVDVQGIFCEIPKILSGVSSQKHKLRLDELHSLCSIKLMIEFSYLIDHINAVHVWHL